MRSAYHAHVSRYVRGSDNPRAAFAEAARMWRGGATNANPGSGNTVTKVAIAGVLIYLGANWLLSMRQNQMALGTDAAVCPCGGLGGIAGCTTCSGGLAVAPDPAAFQRADMSAPPGSGGSWG